jgi:hypothetical protein
MVASLKLSYLKEEEFLDEFYNAAGVAARLLGDEWSPNYNCNDAVRSNQKYLKEAGDLASLVFESASVFHNSKGFHSVQIILGSAKRVVNIAVRQVGDKLLAEKLVDRMRGER